MHDKIDAFLLDATQNAIEAGASVVSVDVFENNNMLECSIGDNGRGMSEETLKSALNPFYSNGKKHPNRRVGLGLPLLKQAAEAAGGIFDIDSKEGEGTSLFFSFDTNNPDCPPFGDLVSCVLSLMLFDRPYDLIFSHRNKLQSYSIVKGELENVLGNLEEVTSIQLARQFIESQEREFNKMQLSNTE